jgi:hypothetical protein
MFGSYCIPSLGFLPQQMADLQRQQLIGDGRAWPQRPCGTLELPALAATARRHVPRGRRAPGCCEGHDGLQARESFWSVLGVGPTRRRCGGPAREWRRPTWPAPRGSEVSRRPWRPRTSAPVAPRRSRRCRYPPAWPAPTATRQAARRCARSRARSVAAVSYPTRQGPWSHRLVHRLAPLPIRGRCPLGAACSQGTAPRSLRTSPRADVLSGLAPQLLKRQISSATDH